MEKAHAFGFCASSDGLPQLASRIKKPLDIPSDAVLNSAQPKEINFSFALLTQEFRLVCWRVNRLQHGRRTVNSKPQHDYE
jgi:hypothetical protein